MSIRCVPELWGTTALSRSSGDDIVAPLISCSTVHQWALYSGAIIPCGAIKADSGIGFPRPPTLLSHHHHHPPCPSSPTPFPPLKPSLSPPRTTLHTYTIDMDSFTSFTALMSFEDMTPASMPVLEDSGLPIMDVSSTQQFAALAAAQLQGPPTDADHPGGASGGCIIA
ncbi:hypothetical protein DL96DRAFT_235989 [Flagelloscypha sp. PMI_526]|nr:hypothetical protein DL96DRAFT_235989 [Flagelloscypha sp. PMI_526]